MVTVGAVMHVFLLLQLLILLVVANGAAVAAKKLLGAKFDRPLDGGALFVDGRPILGSAKTIRGILASVLATSICASLIGLGWEIGALIAALCRTDRRSHLGSLPLGRKCRSAPPR